MGQLPEKAEGKSGFTRRAFLRGSGAVAAATALHTQNAEAVEGANRLVKDAVEITLNVNGQNRKARVEPRTTLLELLRYQFNLTGAKPVSRDGSSGASTVLLNGKPVMASTTFAVTCEGKKVETVESLKGDAVPKAFVEHDAEQCGFCTPGFVMAVRSFLNKNPNATEAQIRAGLNGNICRCGTYANIVQAAVAVVKGGG